MIDSGDVERTARGLIATVNELVAQMPPEVQAQITQLRAEMDGYAVCLREGGMPPGAVGIMLLDSLIHKHHMERFAAITFAMAVLK